MSHANAALTVRHRLKVAQLVVDQRVPISEVAATIPMFLADGQAMGRPVRRG